MIDTRALHKKLTIPCQTKQSTAVFGHLADDYEYAPSTTWFQHLIRMLCFIKYDPNCQRRFINKYRQIYQNNKNNLNILNEFEQQYHHSNFIRWYTKDCFLFHCLNKALRQQDIHTSFLLHFFIYDLFHQVLSIRKLNNQNIQHIVYRGQIITKDELSYLNFSETKRYIYVNAFFSTTMEIRTALIFSGAGSYSKNDEEQSAVFKINIKENNEDYFGIYADIKDFSVNSDENEIIFTMGNAFVIDKVEYNEEEKVWFIELTLDHYGVDTSDWCDPDGDPIEEDESIRICHVNTSNMIEATFIHLGYLLQSAVKSSGTYQQVLIYYQLLRQYLGDFFSIVAYYVSLGLLAFEQKRFQTSLRYQRKALKFYHQKYQSNNNAEGIHMNEQGSNHYLYCISLIIHNCIGSIYFSQNNYDKAIDFYYSNILKNKVNFSCFYPWTMNEILNRLLYIARLWKERNKFESIIQLSDLLEQKRKDNLSFSAFFGLWLDDHPIGNMIFDVYIFLDLIPSIEYDAKNSIELNQQLASKSMEQNDKFLHYIFSTRKLDEPDVLFARVGVLCSQLKRMDLVMWYFERALNICPKLNNGKLLGIYTDDVYMEILSYCYKENNEFSQSQYWLENAYEIRLRNSDDEQYKAILKKDFYLALVDIHKRRKTFHLAVCYCQLAQTYDSKCLKIYEQLASIYENMHQYKDAKICYERAIELNTSLQ